MTAEKELIQFLKESHINNNVSIEPNQDLFKTGVIDSLKTMELIMFIESLRGEPVDLADITPEKLKTVETISNNFFKLPA